MSDLDANFDNQLAAFMGGEKVEEVKEPETVASVSEEETIQEPVKPAEPTTADKAKALGWNPDKESLRPRLVKWSTAGQYLRQRKPQTQARQAKSGVIGQTLKNVEQPIANMSKRTQTAIG